MKDPLLPHQHLFDELQIALLPITQELLTVQTLLKWTKTTLDRESKPTCLSYQNPIEKLSSLRKSTQELSRPLKELMSHIFAFTPFIPLKKALISLNKSYLEIPTIDSELHLLHLGHDLFQDKELILKLLLFTDALYKLHLAALHLKKALLDEVLHHLSLTLDSSKTPHH